MSILMIDNALFYLITFPINGNVIDDYTVVLFRKSNDIHR